MYQAYRGCVDVLLGVFCHSHVLSSSFFYRSSISEGTHHLALLPFNYHRGGHLPTSLPYSRRNHSLTAANSSRFRYWRESQYCLKLWSPEADPEMRIQMQTIYEGSTSWRI